MALKAPKEMQKLGESVEDSLFCIIKNALEIRNSGILVKRGSGDSRDNGEFGDIWLCGSEFEAPLLTIEVKGATRPSSFSLSDYEKRVSVARYVVVDGTHGIWVCPMAVAREHLTQKAEGSDKYWVCNPPFDSRIAFRQMLDEIQQTFGEIPGAKKGVI